MNTSKQAKRTCFTWFKLDRHVQCSWPAIVIYFISHVEQTKQTKAVGRQKVHLFVMNFWTAETNFDQKSEATKTSHCLDKRWSLYGFLIIVIVSSFSLELAFVRTKVHSFSGHLLLVKFYSDIYLRLRNKTEMRMEWNTNEKKVRGNANKNDTTQFCVVKILRHHWKLTNQSLWANKMKWASLSKFATYRTDV